MSFLTYLARGCILTVLACGCKKADMSTENQSPSPPNTPPILTMEIKRIGSGPAGIFYEVALTNMTGTPIRVSGFSLGCALSYLKLRDPSGHEWEVMRPGKPLMLDPPDRVSDFKQLIPPHVSQSVMVGAIPGAVFVMDQNQRNRSTPPKAIYHYSLEFSGLQVSDGDMQRMSEIPLKIEGDTVVDLRAEK
jgi:hypothetical protein